jgi:hypothetical protein
MLTCSKCADNAFAAANPAMPAPMTTAFFPIEPDTGNSMVYGCPSQEADQ